MDCQKLLHPLQQAYKKDKSAATALLTLHEEWMRSLDLKKRNILKGINMSSAFDVVGK